MRGSLTVLFEDPFWIGLYERWEDGKYTVCKSTFGAEPKEYEVEKWLQKSWTHLRFSLPVLSETRGEKRINPKRMQREIRNRVSAGAGIGTKAQQALKAQHEQNKEERKKRSRRQREEERDRQYALHREKKRAKHRGK